MTDIRRPLFVLPVDLGASIVCGSAATGHPVSNLNRMDAIGLTWQATDDAAIWARGQFSSPQTIDFCAIVAANAQAGTQFRLRLGVTQADVDGASSPYDSGVLDFIATTPRVIPDDGLYHSHLELGAFIAHNVVWWRIDITGHTGTFEAAMLVLGQAIEPSHFYNYDFKDSVLDLGAIKTSRFGVLDADPGDVWRTKDFVLGWQSEDEYESYFRPLMQRLGTGNPVYLVWDPADTEDRQARTFMGLMQKPIAVTGHRKPRMFIQEFSLLSWI